jgi:uncharacterized protein (TIGR02452 family)
MSRERAAQLARETVKILEVGRYTAPSGNVVEIGESARRAVEATEAYPPEKTVPSKRQGSYDTRFAVSKESTLEAARRLVGAGHNVAALNFASATNPGGGFLTGARAQEESLCRASGLYACLKDDPMYAYHRARHDPLYSHYVLWSPEVPVFRTDDGSCLEEPWACTFLTCPAVMAKTLLRESPERARKLKPTMWERTLKVLGVAAEKGHSTLVLGAWGCGAFGYDTATMAEQFRKALTENFAGVFARVEFAIVDEGEDERTIGPFREAFREGGGAEIRRF